MTPWGIRNRIKGALGLATKPQQEEQVSLRIVLPDGREHEVRCEPRYTLVMASQTLETPLATGCPDGHCGGCNVDVLDGAEHLVPPSPAERKILDEKWAGKPNVRLACHAKVATSGARIKATQIWTMDSTRGT
ncbi:MAG: 2Fe-2S iron-sulfur cluster-binding protein [Myxococcota bacterium]